MYSYHEWLVLKQLYFIYYLENVFFNEIPFILYLLSQGLMWKSIIEICKVYLFHIKLNSFYDFYEINCSHEFEGLLCLVDSPLNIENIMRSTQ